MEAVEAGYRAVAAKAAKRDLSAALVAKAATDRARLEQVWAEMKEADPLCVPHDFVVGGSTVFSHRLSKG